MLVSSDIFFVPLLMETRTFSKNFRVFRKPEISQRGLTNFSIKKLKLTREIDPQRKRGLANVSGSLWPSMQTLVTQSSSPTNVTRKCVTGPNSVCERGYPWQPCDLHCSFLLHLKHQLGVSLVLIESGIMIVYSSSLCRATGSHSSVLQAWPIVQVLTKTCRTD